jgi:hypothetical protein
LVRSNFSLDISPDSPLGLLGYLQRCIKYKTAKNTGAHNRI